MDEKAFRATIFKPEKVAVFLPHTVGWLIIHHYISMYHGNSENSIKDMFFQGVQLWVVIFCGKLAALVKTRISKKLAYS